MISEEEKFKENLAEMFASKEYPFDEGNWKALQNMNVDNNKTMLFKKRYLLFILTIIGLIGTLVIGKYLMNNKPIATNTSIIKSVNIVDRKEKYPLCGLYWY